MTSRYFKLQNAAHRLNADAYAQQAAHGRVRQFHPCPKAAVLIAACQDKRVLSQVEDEALLTECKCHPGLTRHQLLDMEYQESPR